MKKNTLPPTIRNYAWILFPTWIFYFVLGMYITKSNLESILEIAEKNLHLFFTIFLVISFFMILESKQFNTYELSVKPQIIFLVIITFITLSGLVSFLRKNTTIFDKYIVVLSKHSLNIYFCHVLILKHLKNFYVFSKGMQGMSLLFICVSLLSIGFSILLDFVLRCFKKNKTL